ncbi:MAG: hypothetical protein WAM14_07960 [Candidatus Nitrosopolaris sp.]
MKNGRLMLVMDLGGWIVIIKTHVWRTCIHKEISKHGQRDDVKSKQRVHFRKIDFEREAT